MFLYLTSTGFENQQVANHFKKMITKKEVGDVSFLVISVQDDQSDVIYLQKTKDEINRLGFIDIDVFELKDKPFIPTKQYDVIYVCGGNTFVYLDRIRKTGLDKFIIDSAKSDKSIYVGVSAGSIIVGPDIAIAGWGSEGDPNDIGLQNLSGLGLIDFVVFPHYRDDLKIEVDSFKDKFDYPVYELTDEQALSLDFSGVNVFKNINTKVILDVVNNEDEVIGQASREEVHRDGLLHREIHIYFVTLNRQIIFQHRAKNKETYPDLLDATVGGHVEIGDSYLDTAIKEAAEETGLKIDSQKLILINKTINQSVDKITGKINNAIRTSYLFIFNGDVDDLKIEPGQALGFELWSMDRLVNISNTDSQRFIPYILDFSRKELINFFDQYVPKNN
ncbi:MAG: Type 1 glutamine amidotransferase-like domain-containing protein [Sphaerochaetaceae bacterium]